MECLIQQDYGNFEIIVVDDSSTDLTETKAKNILFKSGHPFKIITHKSNLGVSAARNTGLKAAKGKYIWFVDGDDLADGQFLKIMCDMVDYGVVFLKKIFLMKTQLNFIRVAISEKTPSLY